MREGVHVRYVGEGVREVPGIGVFQKGTVAWVPREVALRLLAEDCFVAEGSGRPVSALVVRLGQIPGPSESRGSSDAGFDGGDIEADPEEPDPEGR